jgi:hypothetical protein
MWYPNLILLVTTLLQLAQAGHYLSLWGSVPI